jgi:hypothetical protein
MKKSARLFNPKRPTTRGRNLRSQPLAARHRGDSRARQPDKELTPPQFPGPTPTNRTPTTLAILLICQRCRGRPPPPKPRLHRHCKWSAADIAAEVVAQQPSPTGETWQRWLQSLPLLGQAPSRCSTQIVLGQAMCSRKVISTTAYY